MGIITKQVEVRPSGKMIRYYRDKGYDAKHRQPLTVNVIDLPEGSSVEVTVKCDVCGLEKNIPYRDYLSSIKKYEYYTCFLCNYIKQQETSKNLYGTAHASQLPKFQKKQQESCLEKYGVSNPMKSQEIREKTQLTNLKKYGVKIASQNEEVREKMMETLLLNYGVDHPMKSDEIRTVVENNMMKKYGVKCAFQIPEAVEKAKQTFIDRYGVDNPNKSTIIREKTKATCLERYGVDNPCKCPEIREKMTRTLYTNSSQKKSKQQQYICDLYHGIINFPVKYYNVDIYLENDNLVVEYDGGGHMLNVITGRETIEEFNQKEIIRNNIIKREGYKQMRIVSTKDLLPSDVILLQMLSQAKEYFSNYPEHSWIEFNIDTSTVRNAEHKDGVFFDFGDLRKIKEVA